MNASPTPLPMNHRNSQELFEKAKTYFPGGVNSPVRAFKAVGSTPLFFKKGEGAYLFDEDDNKYLDFCCSWGPLILGHAHPRIVRDAQHAISNGSSFGAPTKLENQLAELILTNHRYIEKLRFVSSGTEATMTAIRLARGYTKRNKVIKFEGCYHGHADALLVKAGSGLATLGTSSSAGIPQAYVNETLVLPLNNLPALEAALDRYKNEIAAIIIEPIPANNGLLLQDKLFLSNLRTLCSREGILLIFDEVISGFRVGFEGAAGYYDIRPDILTFGKIIGGGLPVGAYAASAEIMNHVAPMGDVYQAGTLSGNPVAMAAGIAQLSECLRPGFYENLKEKTDLMVGRIMQHTKAKDYAFNIFSIGSIFWLSFSENKQIKTADQIDQKGIRLFSPFFHALLKRGVYIGPSGYEVGFVSAAHSLADIQFAAQAFCESLDEIMMG